MNGHSELVRELKSLRKGRGVFAGRIGERVGPALREACGISAGDGPVAIRRKVTARLVELAGQLPDDLRLVARAAFALEDEARLPLYQERVHWAAVRLDRDPRTVRRRVDEAIHQLAELAADAPGGGAGEWHTAELRVAVALDRARPEVLEQRRIVADRDGLRELDLAAPLPVGHDRDVDLDVYYGGTLVDRGGDRPDFGLVLPTPVSRGESHDFAVRFRLPTAHEMRPYLVCVPRHPCELFDLRVRFGPDRAPRRVWTLHGTSGREGADQVRHGHRHPVDPAGEIHLRFRRLTPGLAYGARWEPDDGHRGEAPRGAG